MKVWSNSAIREDFEWVRQKVMESDRVFLLESVMWEVSDRLSEVRSGAFFPDLDLALHDRSSH